MIRQKNLHNYALTFLKIAQEQAALPRYSQQLSDFSQKLLREPLLFQTLNDPLASFQQKQTALIQAIADAGYDQYVANFLELILKQHQEQAYEKIIREFQEAYDGVCGIARGTVCSAFPLSESDLAKLESAFGEKLGLKVFLKQSVNPDLLGGLSVIIQDKIYDNSLLQGLTNFLIALTGDQKEGVWLKRQAGGCLDNSYLPADNVDQKQHVLQAEVSTVVPLTNDQEEALSVALSTYFGHRVIIDTRLDASLLGGVVVRVGDLVLDGSLHRHLDGLRQQLLQELACKAEDRLEVSNK